MMAPAKTNKARFNKDAAIPSSAVEKPVAAPEQKQAVPALNK